MSLVYRLEGRGRSVSWWLIQAERTVADLTKIEIPIYSLLVLLVFYRLSTEEVREEDFKS